MAITITLTAKQGTVKEMKASDISRDMSPDAMWYSDCAEEISTVPHSFSIVDKHWAIWEQGEYIRIKFGPDGSLSNGQGYGGVPAGGNWKVYSVNGTVYIVRRKFINAADTMSSIFNNANRVSASADDILEPGDAIVCAKSDSDFTVEITAPSRCNYYGLPIVQTAD